MAGHESLRCHGNKSLPQIADSSAFLLLQLSRIADSAAFLLLLLPHIAAEPLASSHVVARRGSPKGNLTTVEPLNTHMHYIFQLMVFVIPWGLSLGLAGLARAS